MDLFKRLHDRINEVEATPNVNILIQVWWIPREENSRADALAKSAASSARPSKLFASSVERHADKLIDVEREKIHAGQSSATARCLWRGERVKGQEGCFSVVINVSWFLVR